MSSSLFKITGKVVVVTGATGTLTGSAANYLATQGARVVYLGRSQTKLDAAISAIGKLTPDVLALQADVNDRNSRERAHDTILAKWGRIDCLINGTGGNQHGTTLVVDGGFGAFSGV